MCPKDTCSQSELSQMREQAKLAPAQPVIIVEKT